VLIGLFFLGSVWMTLCGPATESNTYGLSHGNGDNTVSNHGTRSVAAGHKGASHQGHALSARSHLSHLTATHHDHHLNYAFEHNRFTRFSTMTRQVTVTPDVDTTAEKALPPGIELNVDLPDDDAEQTEPASDDSK
jgi:hypothetical protein